MQSAEPPVGMSPHDILKQAAGRLGFGSSPLYSGRTREQSLGIIHAALDEGVTYFDTARMYGDGAAEHLLGEVLSKQRSKLIITTKAGILPPEHLRTYKIYRRVISAARKVPGVKQVLQEPPYPEPIHPAFEPATIRKSLETSLRALRTDYVDIFLLHECDQKHASDPDVTALLEQLKNEGKIRTYGSATSVETTFKLAKKQPGLMPLLQTKSNAWERTAEHLLPLTESAVITHTTLGPSFRSFTENVRSDDSLRKLAKSLDIDPDDGVGLAVLLVAHALQSNPQGVVLFSTVNPKHLRATLTAPGVSHDKKAKLQSLVEAEQAMRVA